MTSRSSLRSLSSRTRLEGILESAVSRSDLICHRLGPVDLYELTDSVQLDPRADPSLPALAFSLLFRFQGAEARARSCRRRAGGAARGAIPVRGEELRYPRPRRSVNLCRQLFRRGSRACPCGARTKPPLSRSDARSRPSSSSTRLPARTAPWASSRLTSLFDLARPAPTSSSCTRTPSMSAGSSTVGTSAATTAEHVGRAVRRIAAEEHLGGPRRRSPPPRSRGPSRSARRPGRAGRPAAPARRRARRAAASSSSSGRSDSIFR